MYEIAVERDKKNDDIIIWQSDEDEPQMCEKIRLSVEQIEVFIFMLRKVCDEIVAEKYADYQKPEVLRQLSTRSTA